MAHSQFITCRCRLGEAVVQEGLLTQDQINWALAQHFGLAYVDIAAVALDRELVRSIRAALLYQHRILPLTRLRNVLTLAMADPTDGAAILEVSDATGCEVEPAIADANAVLAALDSAFSPQERRVALAEEPVAEEFAAMAAHRAPRQRLGEILVQELLITPEQLDAALALQKQQPKRLGEVLIDTGILTEDQINWALARHLDVPYVDLDPDSVDESLLDLLPLEFFEEHEAVPMMRIGNQFLLAMVDPLDRDAIAQVARASGCDVVASIAARGDIEAFLDRRRHRMERSAAVEGASRPADTGELAFATPEIPAGETSMDLSADAAQAFKETLQHSPVPSDEKVRVYNALHSIADATQRGSPEVQVAVREKAFASLTPAGMKLALQLLRQVGHRPIPILKDEEFVAKHGRAGALIPADRRFVVDRREYDRTIASVARRYGLSAVQIDNAVMAARAHVLSGGQREVLLITEGERGLANALTKIVRLARTREWPGPGPSQTQGAYDGPERRGSANQKAIDAALARTQLPPENRDKAVRAFRLIHSALGGSFDRGKLKELIRRGAFFGFSPEEINLVEAMMRAQGYDLPAKRNGRE